MTVNLGSGHSSIVTNGIIIPPVAGQQQNNGIAPPAPVAHGGTGSSNKLSASSLVTASLNGTDQTRHRQHFTAPMTPNDSPRVDYDVKDTQHVSPMYDNQSYHQPNGRSSNFRNRSPSTYRLEEGATLSSFLSKVISTATHSLSSQGKQSTRDGHGASTTNVWSSILSGSNTLKANVGFVALCGLWYLSSAFSSNTGKSIMTRFRYPVTLTFVQFAFVAGYCVLFLAVREQSKAASHASLHPNQVRHVSLGTMQGWGIRKPSRSMFQGTLMMSLFQIAGHVFSSMAIARVPVSTVHTIKALSPLFTVISYAALFGVRYGTSTYIALLPLTLGVMLACSFDLRANAVGFLCALGSTVIFVSQNIFSKKLLPKESSSGTAAPSQSSANGNAKQLDKLNLLFYSSGMAFFLMIPIWLYSDAGTLLNAWLDPDVAATNDAGSTASLVFTFFLNGSVHFGQNLLAFSILARTSPVTYSIASLIKRIAVICIAIVWSGQKVSFIQAAGMTMTFAGLWMYNSAKSDVDKGERKRGALEKRQEMFLPSTATDVRELEGSTPPPQEDYRPAYAGINDIHVQSTTAAPRNRSSLANQLHYAPPPPPTSAPPPHTIPVMSNGHAPSSHYYHRQN